MKKDEILRLIARHICEVVPGLKDREIKPGDRLADLGANSVDRAEIIMMTMEALSLQIPRVELFSAGNIGQLVDIFHEKLRSA